MTRFLALVDVLNYVFHVSFTEGWKCDLFAPFFGQSPFLFFHMFEMEIVQKKGTSCRRLVCINHVCPNQNFESQDDDSVTMRLSKSQLRVTR
jgi:hypothetical protein